MNLPTAGGWFNDQRAKIKATKEKMINEPDKENKKVFKKEYDNLRRELVSASLEDPGTHMDQLKENIDVLVNGRHHDDLSKEERKELIHRLDVARKTFKSYGREMPPIKLTKRSGKRNKMEVRVKTIISRGQLIDSHRLEDISEYYMMLDPNPVPPSGTGVSQRQWDDATNKWRDFIRSKNIPYFIVKIDDKIFFYVEGKKRDAETTNDIRLQAKAEQIKEARQIG